jgi:hypothetical protein
MLSFGNRHPRHSTDCCLCLIQEKGRMHMNFLQAQVPDLKEITDYKREMFEFHTRDVHSADQMDLHR